MSAATKSVSELDYHLQLFASYLSNHNNEILLGVLLILTGDVRQQFAAENMKPDNAEATGI